MRTSRVSQFLLQPRFVVALYAVLTVLVSFQHYFKGSINNYLIFVKPFFNLVAGNNLYLEYPEYYYDTYKYSPVFALFMGVFAWMPNWLGLLLWNVLNNTVLYLAGRRLFPDVRRQLLFLLLVFIDVMTALHNSQANCLLVGLMLWTYFNLENKKPVWAGLCIALAFLIKIYGVGIGLLFLFYPGFIRNSAWAAFWVVVLAFTPLLVVSWADFQMIYIGWYDIVRASTTGVQLSLMGVLDTWLGLSVSKGAVQVAGLALLLLPLAYWQAWRETHYRRLYVASILIFVVIFNQMAESPTFIIAVTGFVFWFLHYRRSTPLAWGLFALVALFTSLSATDIYPHFIRSGVFDTYKIKAVPMILAWAVIQGQLLLYPRWRQRLAASSEAAQQQPADAPQPAATV
ncbi:glycosyltransferase family 87 protein [Hymenobacter elongatus]|nr:glycosyltransferase family 87 protein [Hymenobacter elongatus]